MKTRNDSRHLEGGSTQVGVENELAVAFDQQGFPTSFSHASGGSLLHKSCRGCFVLKRCGADVPIAAMMVAMRASAQGSQTEPSRKRLESTGRNRRGGGTRVRWQSR